MKEKCIFILNLFLLLTIGSVPAQNSYSGTTNVQLLFGEDVASRGVSITTLTAEHVGAFGKIEHFGFTDFSYTHKTEDLQVYTEWYPKLALKNFNGNKVKWNPLAKILIGGGINTMLSDPENFFVVLGGPVWQFEVPGFNLFQLETYLYQHLEFSSSYQITLTIDAPVSISEKIQIRLRGFIDLIGPYDTYATQVVAQPQVLVDIGNFYDRPGNLFAGIEYRYWNNFGGQEGVIESIPQLEILYKF